jgi:hypothetical protein
VIFKLYEKRTILIIIIIYILYFNGTIEFSYTLTNRTSDQNDKNSLKNIVSSNVITTVVAFGGIISTIFITFYQIKKRQEEKTIEYNNSLEYDYSIDLRRRRYENYIGLWELTQIKYSKDSPAYEIENHKKSLSNWYYDKGHGMLLTEHSQKLFYNFKKYIEDISGTWKNLTEEDRDNKIKDIESAASALRTNLLKDVGTRISLRNLPSYNQLIIKDPKQKYDKFHGDCIEFRYAFFGNLDLDLKNKNILFLIMNLDENVPVYADWQFRMTLNLGEWYFFLWNQKGLVDGELLNPGNYSITITISDILSSEIQFQLSEDLILNVKNID